MSKKKSTQKIIVIVGPTASGKSEYAVRLAQKINGEIISADSRQVYRGLDIGSGKIAKKEMRGIRHYCLDIADPKKTFTADNFQKAASAAITAIIKKGKIPILVGGTGFYIDTTIYRSNLPNIAPDREFRKKLEKQSAEILYRKLITIDKRRARNIDPHNKRRLIRALEITAKLGRVPALTQKPRYRATFIGLNLPKEVLKKRISHRVDTMLRKGLIRETQRLIKQKIPRKRIMEFGFEYRYPLLYLEGKISKEKMRERIKTETWHYAKRQITWFRRQKETTWILP